jgi:hypothetical protein
LSTDYSYWRGSVAETSQLTRDHRRLDVSVIIKLSFVECSFLLPIGDVPRAARA